MKLYFYYCEFTVTKQVWQGQLARMVNKGDVIFDFQVIMSEIICVRRKLANAMKKINIGSTLFMNSPCYGEKKENGVRSKGFGK